jgi:hypothetical protein
VLFQAGHAPPTAKTTAPAQRSTAVAPPPAAKLVRGSSNLRSTQADSLVVHFDDASDEEFQEETVTKRVVKRTVDVAPASEQPALKKAKAQVQAPRRTVVTTVRVELLLPSFMEYRKLSEMHKMH